jgi:hypothetical protein
VAEFEIDVGSDPPLTVRTIDLVTPPPLIAALAALGWPPVTSYDADTENGDVCAATCHALLLALGDVEAAHRAFTSSHMAHLPSNRPHRQEAAEISGHGR